MVKVVRHGETLAVVCGNLTHWKVARDLWWHNTTPFLSQVLRSTGQKIWQRSLTEGSSSSQMKVIYLGGRISSHIYKKLQICKVNKVGNLPHCCTIHVVNFPHYGARKKTVYGLKPLFNIVVDRFKKF